MYCTKGTSYMVLSIFPCSHHTVFYSRNENDTGIDQMHWLFQAPCPKLPKMSDQTEQQHTTMAGDGQTEVEDQSDSEADLESEKDHPEIVVV